jgi:hypothetical protein
MTNKDALNEIFSLDNGTLSQALTAPYNTVASWRFKHHRGDLSLEKEIEIISKMNFKLQNTIKWKRQAK